MLVIFSCPKTFASVIVLATIAITNSAHGTVGVEFWDKYNYVISPGETEPRLVSVYRPNDILGTYFEGHMYNYGWTDTYHMTAEVYFSVGGEIVNRKIIEWPVAPQDDYFFERELCEIHATELPSNSRVDVFMLGGFWYANPDDWQGCTAQLSDSFTADLIAKSMIRNLNNPLEIGLVAVSSFLHRYRLRSRTRLT